VGGFSLHLDKMNSREGKNYPDRNTTGSE